MYLNDVCCIRDKAQSVGDLFSGLLGFGFGFFLSQTVNTDIILVCHAVSAQRFGTYKHYVPACKHIRNQFLRG